MPKEYKSRIIYILKYLWQNTDEEHTATHSQIVDYLAEKGIDATPRTVAADITELIEFGFDIICNKSTQNHYFIGSRVFELPEVKMLIDAIQAAQFIPQSKADEMIKKMRVLSSCHQSDVLQRNLIVSKIKGDNTQFLYTVDLINTAINEMKQIRFQYINYDRQGHKALMYDGHTYTFSPLAIVWNMDNYYVAGFSKNTEKVIKFRIDKIVKPLQTDIDSLQPPDGFDLSKICQSSFLMYGDSEQAVTLRCDYEVMDSVINRFGEDIEIVSVDEQHFDITETVFTGSTFYSWLFNYCGKIRIIAPESAIEDFKKMLHAFDEPEKVSDDLPF